MQFGRIFKVKEGKLEKVKAWFETLNTSRRDEAIATFDYEGVTREVFVLFLGNDGNHYVLGLNEVEESKEHKSGDPSVQINQEHNAIREECLEPFSKRGEVIMDLQK